MASENTSNEKPLARPPVETIVLPPEPRRALRTALIELSGLLARIEASPERARLITLTVGLIGILLINMFGQIALNRWLGEFYRAIENKDLSRLLFELGTFAGLVALLLTVVVSQTWVHERLKVRLRECLTHTLLDTWLVHGRPYRLNISADETLKPDQRIQEDARTFSEISADLFMGFVQSGLLLVSFIGVLWSMSENVRFTYGGTVFAVPGYMVWVAVFYALAGATLTANVGRPLISLNELRYEKEAEFRFSLSRINESAESIAFYAGEEGERRIINRNLNQVIAIMLKVSAALARLTWITSGYGWIMIVLPIVVALPGYLQGTMDLGGLMMVVGAFNQVQTSLRWFVDSFPKIADWQAALHRVAAFGDAAETVDEYENQTEQIALADHPEGYLSFEKTKISLIDGEVVIADATAQIVPGERVLIEGESGTGKSTLFRAVSGLWPWGSGVIRLPPRDEMMFLPQRPYMPLGTLATALCYPRPVETLDRELLREALRRVNLEHLFSLLDQTERWDKILSLGEQQRLAFARLILHKPKWVFLDEATSALDEPNQENVMSLFTTELSGSTIMSISHRPELAQYHTRTLQLITTKSGTVLRRRPRRQFEAELWRKAKRLFQSDLKNSQE